jgi:hypothetical protein
MDKGFRNSEPNEAADKGVKTRNSGESGYVDAREKPAASAILRGPIEQSANYG